MNWKISDLIAMTTEAELQLAEQAGDFDAEFRRMAHRLTRHKRYRRKKAALNVRRVHAVANELRAEFAA